MLIVCGAERTEPRYLAGLRDSLGSRAVDLHLVRHARSPKQVVGYARKYAQTAARDFDEVWCVVDVDDFDITAAAEHAAEAGIELAVSNPCFELWLLLHHEDCRRRLDRCDDATRRLRRHVPGYDKALLHYADYAAGLDEAMQRARALEPTAEKFDTNPSSSVWRLVERLVE